MRPVEPPQTFFTEVATRGIQMRRRLARDGYKLIGWECKFSPRDPTWWGLTSIHYTVETADGRRAILSVKMPRPEDYR